MHCEEQLIILTAVKRKLERIEPQSLEFCGNAYQWQPAGPDSRANATRFTEVLEIGREAVGGINRGRSDLRPAWFIAGKPSPEIQPNGWTKVRREQAVPALPLSWRSGESPLN